MTIIGLFRNNVAVFMSQFSKFPISPTRRIIDAVGATLDVAYDNAVGGSLTQFGTLNERLGMLITDDSSNGKKVKVISASLQRVNISTGPIFALVCNSSLIEVARSPSIDTGTIQTGSFVDFFFTLNKIILLQNGDKVTLQHSGDDATDRIAFDRQLVGISGFSFNAADSTDCSVAGSNDADESLVMKFDATP